MLGPLAAGAWLSLSEPLAPLRENAGLPSLGLDLFLTAGGAVATLPAFHEDRLMHVAVKGGEAAHARLANERRDDPSRPALIVPHGREQSALAVGRVMAEGSLHDLDLAALAVVEVAFLSRAYRTPLSGFGTSVPLHIGAMACSRRISATPKDLPNGKGLGLVSAAAAARHAGGHVATRRNARPRGADPARGPLRRAPRDLTRELAGAHPNSTGQAAQP